jgi:hypothetical protein
MEFNPWCGILAIAGAFTTVGYYFYKVNNRRFEEIEAQNRMYDNLTPAQTRSPVQAPTLSTNSLPFDNINLPVNPTTTLSTNSLPFDNINLPVNPTTTINSWPVINRGTPEQRQEAIDSLKNELVELQSQYDSVKGDDRILVMYKIVLNQRKLKLLGVDTN